MSAATLAMRNVQSLMTLDPAKMQLINALLKLLMGDMDVAVVRNVPDAKSFVASEGLAFTVLSATGSCMLGSDESVDHACDVLDAADSMLRHVEARLGIAIEPGTILPAGQTVFVRDEAIVVRLAHEKLALLLAFEPDAEQSAQWVEASETATPDLADIPVPVSIEFEAAKLTVADTARIESGDMLLLPRKAQATWQCALPQAGRLSRQAVIDLQDMKLHIGGPHFDQEEIGMSDDDTGEPSAAFQVPVTVRLPTQYVDAATLAGMQSGGSLQLGPLVHGLPVELLVGGRRIAGGEIVEIGENFAVLIDERDAQPAVTEATGEVDLGAPMNKGE